LATHFLFERMLQWRDEPAIIYRDREVRYGELLEKVARFEGELKQRAVGAGRIVLIEGMFSPNSVALLLALIRMGAIAVPVTPMVRVHRDEYAAIAEASTTFVIDEVDDFSVQEHPCETKNALTHKLTARGHAGLVIFSSGSTGKPKAVLHDFHHLLEKFRPTGPRKRTLAFLLFDHIGGLDTLFNTLANGGSLITVPQRDPDTVCRSLATHEAHTLPASPTFLNLMLISGAWREYDLSRLQVIAYGSEPMPQSLLERLRDAFPNARLVQTYGMSELGVLRTRSRDDGSLWIKFKNLGFETKVVDGILWVKTESAMMGYLNAPDLFTEDGWLNTEDAVEQDGEFIRILGRATDLINVGGQKVYPSEVESILLDLDNVRDVTVYGERNPLTGHILAAKISLMKPEPFAEFKKRLRSYCKERLPTYKIPARIEVTNDEQYGIRLKKFRPHSETVQSPEMPTKDRGDR